MILIMVFFAGTFGMNFQITSALMATEVFGKGAGEFGMLGSAMAVGSLAGALMAARRVRIRVRLLVVRRAGVRRRRDRRRAAAVVRRRSRCSCPVIGFCTLTLLNSANATMQLESDPALRGRVMALYMTIVMGGTPARLAVIGWIGRAPRGPLDADHRGACSTIVGVALVAVLRVRAPRVAGVAHRFDPVRARVISFLVSGTTRPLRVLGIVATSIP